MSQKAKDLKLTVEELKALQPGKPRRSKHDDMTVLVLFFDKREQQATPFAAVDPNSSTEEMIMTTLAKHAFTSFVES